MIGNNQHAAVRGNAVTVIHMKATAGVREKPKYWAQQRWEKHDSAANTTASARSTAGGLHTTRSATIPFGTTARAARWASSTMGAAWAQQPREIRPDYATCSPVPTVDAK